MPQAGPASVHSYLQSLSLFSAQEMGDDGFAVLEEALTQYSQEMHDYTLQLWAQSRREAEEKRAESTVGKKKKVGKGQEAVPKGKPEQGKRPPAEPSTSRVAGKASTY